MQKIILSLFTVLMVATISFTIPSQAHAAWWNPLSWLSKNQGIEQPKQEKQNEADKEITKQQTLKQKTEVAAEQNAVAPTTTSQPLSDTKMIEDLKSEIATLKNSLDNLYAAHNRLVNDHNALLEYTKSIVASKLPSSGGSNSVLEKKVSVLNLTIEELSNKLTSVCRQTFSSSIGTPSQVCPSSLPIGGSTLESRIRKLEGGY